MEQKNDEEKSWTQGPLSMGTSYPSKSGLDHFIADSSGNRIGHTRKKADAILYAASPDMYNALEWCLEELKYLRWAPDSAYARPDDDLIAAVDDILKRLNLITREEDRHEQ